MTRSEVQLKRPQGASRGVEEGRAQGPSRRKLLVGDRLWSRLETGAREEVRDLDSRSPATGTAELPALGSELCPERRMTGQEG